MNKTSYDLPCFGRQKSFYGKATIQEIGDFQTLVSYSTKVASYNKKTGGFFRHWDGYSATTMRHVNSFLKYVGVSGGGKSWWENMEVTK